VVTDGGIIDNSSSTPTITSSGNVNELTTYLDSDPVPWGDPNFDILLWWSDHKQSYPILSIMARDIMAVPVSTMSSESCFSLTGRILEERRRRLLLEHVEMLTCIKDWDQDRRKEQHTVVDKELVELFKNLEIGDSTPEDEDTVTGSGTRRGSVGVSVGIIGSNDTYSGSGRGGGSSGGRGGGGSGGRGGGGMLEEEHCEGKFKLTI
jgi:uncharacterized membrane protein YgcG